MIVRFTSPRGASITGEVVAATNGEYCVFAVWGRNGEASLFWLPSRMCQYVGGDAPQNAETIKHTSAP